MLTSGSVRMLLTSSTHAGKLPAQEWWRVFSSGGACPAMVVHPSHTVAAAMTADSLAGAVGAARQQDDRQASHNTASTSAATSQADTTPAMWPDMVSSDRRVSHVPQALQPYGHDDYGASLRQLCRWDALQSRASQEQRLNPFSPATQVHVPSRHNLPLPLLASQATFVSSNSSGCSSSTTTTSSTSSHGLGMSNHLTADSHARAFATHERKHKIGFRHRRRMGNRRKPQTYPVPATIQAIIQRKMGERVKLEEPKLPPPVLKPLTPFSYRTGCIAIKAGMTQEWDEYGVRVPLTVLWIDECQVVGIKFPERNGYYALQLGAGYTKQKSLPPHKAGYYLKQGVPFKKKMFQWRVSEDALLPVGTHITAAHYKAGQRVDVTGWTKYKGFQGVMKRWGFKGLDATHGVSKAHRKPGSIGSRQDPGRVWKGKKLPGHMGDERRTVTNCLMYKVDPKRNLLYLRGQVPGPVGKFVYLRDALRTSHEARMKWDIPFPTFVGDPMLAPVTVAKSDKDPFLMYRAETDYFPINWKKGE